MGTIALEEYELMKDSKYRVYVSAVDKALKSFEYTSEWADLISALGKLNKVLISHTKFPVIPRRIKISKRLAQCMHPALPSGVHLKALETYDIIFKCMGTNRLSHELFIYSAGLFPLLGHAAMNVRPSLLTVYETHFVPLGERLGPGLSGFLSGVLPGLEEGSDHFERTNSLLENVCEGGHRCSTAACGPAQTPTRLCICPPSHSHSPTTTTDSPLRTSCTLWAPTSSVIFPHCLTNSLLEKVCEGVGASLFYGCLWDCLASNAAVRLPAISFALAHYDRRLSTEDQLHIMGTNIDIMIEGLCACVHDSSVLVQRSALDLLLVGFPMHNSQLVKSDMTRLVTASLATILRRDMSLNRRLYAWLLGSEVNIALLSSEHPLVKKSKSSESLASTNLANLYFEMYSREMLVQAIKNVLREATGQSPHDLRPYRLLVSLLDKVDIGPVILDDILFEVFRLLYLCCSGSTKSNSVELFKSANLLFSSLEPRYMWQYCGQLVASACGRAHTSDSASSPVHPIGSGDPGLVEVCALTEFLLDTVSLETYSDTPSEHLPALFLHIVMLLTDHCDMLSPVQTARALQLCAKILTRVQPTITSHHHRDTQEEQQKDGTGTDTTSVSDSVSQSSHTSVATASTVPVSQHSKENHSVLEQCLRQYEKFYVTFVYGTRLKVGETKSISVLLETLKIKSNQTSYEERAKQLETLLRAVLDDKGGGRPAVGDAGDLDMTPIFMSGRRVGGVAGLEWAPAMTVASRLLVDLSTLQTFFQVPSANNILDQNDSELESSIDILPEWLRVLIVCACWLHSSTALQMIAISTLLDLVTLCRTAQSLVASSNSDHQSVTTVLILPLLTSAHLRYMENHTNIFQVIAHWLWGQLRSGVATERVRSVELLHQLQSALATSDVVEDCIGEAFMTRSSGGKLEAFRTFATLWHIGREVNARLGNSLRVTDIFYKSMLKMLDNLQLPDSSALKVEAQNWLLHSLLRGDIHRLLDPILMMLLDPATARVSVLHVRIQQHDEANMMRDPANADDKTPCIYAISSVDGNVIYHVSEKGETKPGKAKRVFSVQTKLAGQDSSKLSTKFVTEKKATISTDDMGDPYQAHSNNLNLLKNISVFVNPFSRDAVHKTEAINTDFDDYYEEQKEQNGELIGKAIRITATDLDKNKSKSIEGSNRLGSGEEKQKHKNVKVQRNNSFTSLDHDFARSDSNQTTKSSIDLLQLSSLSDTIFTKVSEGESLIEKARNGRGSVSSEGLVTAASADGNNEMVRSWSFPGKDSDSCEPEESASAEDYFKSPNVSETWNQLRDSDGWTVVEEVMCDLLDRVAALSGEVEMVKESSSSEPSLRSNSMSTPRAPRRHLQYRASLTSGTVDHLHSHLLLYCGVYDSQRALYALHTVRNMLATNARAFLCSSSTTGLVSRSPLLKLVARHRKSIFGRGFLGDLDTSSTRSCMYVEVIITTCLYYMRSFYPNLGQNKLTSDEIHANRQVQISSVELLSLVCYELTAIVRDSGRGLACYLADLLSRIKLQKITLHCVLSSIPPASGKTVFRSFTHEILTFNENTDESLANQSEAFQVQILRFLLSLIMLEHEVNQRKGEGEESKPSSHESTHSNGELRYMTGRAIPQQPMLLAAILRALEAPGRASYAHTHWTALVTCALPYLGSSLTRVVTAVVKQLCSNVEQLSRAYDPTESDHVRMPADYAITQVEALTVLCHYCLLDTATPFTSPLGGTSTPAQIFNNLIHVFMPSPLLMNKDKPEPQASARKAVLSNLPRVIASVAVLWHALTQRKERESENCEAGSARVVRQQLLEFLSPIALHHGTSFLAAMAVVWRERRPTTLQTNYAALTQAREGQQVLVQLLSAIKAMPIDTLVQTLHQVVKQPAMNQQTAMSVEVSALELFLYYLQLVAGVSLGESWASLLSLLREGPSLSAPAQFLLVGVLSQFVHRCPPLQDKKDVRDLQDITAKLVESCSQIAGANLEQTTWLRRNLAVKEEEIPQPPSPECTDKYEEIESEPVVNGIDNLTSYDVSPAKKNKSKSKLKRVTKKIRQDAEKLQIRALHQWFSRSFVHEGNFPVDPESLRNSPGTTSVAQYSVAALTVLAQLLAPLLDVTYGSQEKERVVALLTALMYNVTPYLKNHTVRNAGSFYVCSQLVASLSGFQYTRKAWRKDVMDLLLDSTLFQMEARTLAFWRTIVDNLMSQDTATFRDLMSRVSMSQGNSLSLFSSREQEYEQRAQLLKRLAFVILCSEKDQFHKHTPDIQERLAESLRLPQVVPGVQSQVFLCFRVLLLRMSPHHVTSLWPIIVSEMVQVMLHMEHDLSTDTEEFRRNNSSHIRLLSALDWSWVINSNNGLHANGHPHWLQLQLAAAKLLYLAVQLPADTLPQFQMYRWAFVSPKCSSSTSQANADFIPHVTRIARLMDAKFGGPPEQIPLPLLPPGGSIRALSDLHPFFTVMSSGHFSPLSLAELETDIELDFLEPMPLR